MSENEILVVAKFARELEGAQFEFESRVSEARAARERLDRADDRVREAEAALVAVRRNLGSAVAALRGTP